MYQTCVGLKHDQNVKCYVFQADEGLKPDYNDTYMFHVHVLGICWPQTLQECMRDMKASPLTRMSGYMYQTYDGLKRNWNI